MYAREQKYQRTYKDKCSDRQETHENKSSQKRAGQKDMLTNVRPECTTIENAAISKYDVEENDV